jgi:Tfp pilus assembly protein PilN
MKNLIKKQAVAPLPWHPDFRDLSTLPDVKVVRTDFLVNGVCILVLGIVLYLFGSQELRRYELSSETKARQSQMSQNKARHDQVLQLHRDYQTHERFILDLSAYLEDSLNLSPFLVALGNTLPPEVDLAGLRYQDVTERGQSIGKQILLHGSVRGAPDAAATSMTEYLKVFAQDALLAEKVERAVSTSLAPTPDGELMAFGIQLTLKSNRPAAEPPARGRGRTAR